MTDRKVIFIGNNEMTLGALLAAPARVVAAIHEQEHDLKFTHCHDEQLAAGGGRLYEIEKNSRPALEALLNGLPAVDLYVVSIFGILSQKMLQRPRLGCLNIHPSLLPDYKGPYPVQWCLINGERQTGVTFMKLDPGVDTGGIYRTAALAIEDEDDARTIMDKQDRLVDQLLPEVIEGVFNGRLQARQQEGPGSYFPRLTAEVRYVNFFRMTARDVHNITRSQVRYGGCMVTWRQKRLECGWSQIIEESSRASRGGKILKLEQTDRGWMITVQCVEGSLILMTGDLPAGMEAGDSLGT